MTINIGTRGFTFDSLAPVQGVVYDEQRELIKTQMIHNLITTFIALDVVAAGSWLCKWWYYGGFAWMRWALNHWAPGLLGMAEHGFL